MNIALMEEYEAAYEIKKLTSLSLKAKQISHQFNLVWKFNSVSQSLNITKRSNRQRINLKNIQATPEAQFQKNKWPNQKMGQRTEQTFLQRRHTDG